MLPGPRQLVTNGTTAWQVATRNSCSARKEMGKEGKKFTSDFQRDHGERNKMLIGAQPVNERRKKGKKITEDRVVG